MKIKVGIPFYSEFEDAKAGLHELIQLKEHQFKIEPRQGVLVGRMRNEIIKNGNEPEKFQKLDRYDAFLFVDSDITFQAADVERLIRADKDIISGVYQSQKDDNFEAGLFYPHIPGAVMTRFNSMTRGKQKVDFCGGGFVLIKREVFEKTEYPWFRHYMVTNNGQQEEVGEDYGFCINAKKHGFDIWADFDCQVRHRIRQLKDFNWSLH